MACSCNTYYILLIVRRADSYIKYTAITRFIEELVITCWSSGFTSLTLTNYPILRSFSMIKDYQWDYFTSLSIHDLPVLESINIGINTIPNTQYLNIFSNNIFTKLRIDLPKLKTIELHSIVNVYSIIFDSKSSVYSLFY